MTSNAKVTGCSLFQSTVSFIIIIIIIIIIIY
jgi:hypothetical protein